jgi:AcrR family transcriptional regulator
MEAPQSGVRAPQQKRSRDSLERVLRAAEKLLEKNGYDGFTIAEVSRRARLSVGSVYGRFESKDALIYAVHRRMIDRQAEAFAAGAPAAPAGDLAAAVTSGVQRLADAMDSQRDLLRVFMHLAPVDVKIAEGASEVSRAVGRDFTAAVLAHRDEIKHPLPERAVDVAYRIPYDVLARRIMYGPTFESELTIAWDDLVDEVAQAAIAYLTSERR